MKSLRIVPGLVVLLTLSACSAFGRFNPTPVVAPIGEDQAQVEFEAVVSPSPAPFTFNLPTPGAEPVSGWRPPLYPVPWALSPYDHFYFTRPIAADQVNWPTPDYRYGGVYFAPNIVHTGVDIPAPEGIPIMAAGPGTVVWSGWGLFTEAPNNKDDPYGLAVAIRHDFGYKDQQLYTIYAHMSENFAIQGQHVETGEILGLVGATGATTGPHLHFEVRFPTNSFFATYNPELWIAPPQGWGVLVGRVMDVEENTLQGVEVRIKAVNGNFSQVVKTYGGGGAINPDPYYNENLALGDIPAGIYNLKIIREGKTLQTWVEIFPGQVTYFTYIDEIGFSSERPPAPKLQTLPELLPATPTLLP
jgi:murein DD-endopeptidase MepM/ murein hydrolase activator NlpD